MFCGQLYSNKCALEQFRQKRADNKTDDTPFRIVS